MPITPTVRQLLALNILFYIGSQLLPQAYEYLALHYIEHGKFAVWQLLTHMFMHAPLPNLMHILFNMFALYSFGSALEQYWGPVKFLFFYLSCGLGAAFMQMGIYYWEVHEILKGAADLGLSDYHMRQILNAPFTSGSLSYNFEIFKDHAQPILTESGRMPYVDNRNFNAMFEAALTSRVTMVGASGAIYGLLVAFAFMFPNLGLMLIFVPVPIKAKYFVPGLLAVDLFLGFKGNSIFGGGTGIAHFAHIGGALVGFLMMWVWRRNQFNDNRWD